MNKMYCVQMFNDDMGELVMGYATTEEKAKKMVEFFKQTDGFEELVNGVWITYDVSTSNSPDSSNHSWDFDGYQVHYDGNGTYSYSFVVEMTDGKTRTFRVIAE